jgi:hypothetical protein
MKTAAWFIISELLLLLMIGLVFSNWHGSVNFAFAWPLSGCTLNITGGAQGGQVLLAFASAILTLATFITGLVRLVKGPSKARATSASATPGRTN